MSTASSAATSSPVNDSRIDAFLADVGTEGVVAVAGARTRWSLGGELSATARVVTAPSGIVQYEPAEMTVRVRAGTTVADLAGELAVANQRCALPERGGTVGGAVMVGENGPYVLGRGPLRNSVLQVGYVSAEGKWIIGGGPTVKNVSGFDLPRLLTGSLGTLGLLGDVILRTNPIPAVSRWLVSSDADPFAVFDQLLRPGGIFFDGTRTTVLLEGHDVDVEAERAGLDRVGTFVDVATDNGLPKLPGHRWSLQPAELRSIDASATGDYVALIGVGTVYAAQPQPDRPNDAAASEVATRMKHLFDPTGRLNPGRTTAGAAG